jgi:3-oxoadipate CoA-transferase alpha subunit
MGHRWGESIASSARPCRADTASTPDEIISPEPANRTVTSKETTDIREAVSSISDGATVMIGGFGRAGQPVELIDALIEHGARDLTIVSNNAGSGDTGIAALLAARRVRKVVCSFPRQSDSWVFDRMYRAGEVELELVPQGNLAERIRAAGAGIGAFFTPTGVGTDLAAGKEHRTINGCEYVLEYPIFADAALISALRGDRYGNLIYRKTGRNFGPIMATAATTTIAQVDVCVEPGGLDPESIVTPGIFVDCVVPVGERSWLADGHFIGGTDAAGAPLSPSAKESQ